MLLSFSTLQYFSHFWPLNFCTISVQSLLYTPNSVIFTPIQFFYLPLFWKHTCLGVFIFPPVHTNDSVRAMHKWGGGGRVMQVAKIIARVGTQNYSGNQFISPIQGPILGPSPVPGFAGDWGDEICGSYGSTALRQRLQSGHWHNHVLVKGLIQKFAKMGLSSFCH